MCARTCGSQKRMSDNSGTGVTGICEPPDMDVGPEPRSSAIVVWTLDY